MKHLLIIGFLYLTVISVNAQSKPYYPPTLGFVDDFENDFTADERRELNSAIKDLLSQTMEKAKLRGIEMAVVTVTDSMYGDSKEMSDYATALGDKWGLGTKEPNRGLIIAYSKKVRKVSIVTGSGFDQLLPREVCRSIIDDKMAAEFRRGKPYDALYVGVKAIAAYLGIVIR